MKRIRPLFVTAAAALLAYPAVSSAKDAEPAAADVAEATPDEGAKDVPALPETREVFIEADLPLGFPTPGPAYEVLLKEYPVYRAARAEGSHAFRKLFNHIQSHGIPMTAPVEMTLAPTPAPGSQGNPGSPENLEDSEDSENVSTQAVIDRDGFARIDMLFMYTHPDMGQLGQDPTARPGQDVEVVQLPPMQVLSLGFFGNADRGQVNDALAMLQRHLADRDDLVAVGPPRLMGYNSPMVPARNRYSEVQIPVRPAEPNVSNDAPATDAP